MKDNHPQTEDFWTEASAESNSLHRMTIDPNAIVHLLHTDTQDGKVCAEALKDLLSGRLLKGKKLCKTIELYRVQGLQVDDRDKFRREGINSLFSALDKLYTEAGKLDDRDIALNITGGFKAVVPYVTLFGLLYRIPVVYIFERSNALITLPPAAINFDFDRMAQAAEAIVLLEQEGAITRDRFFEHIDPNPTHWERDWFDALLEEEDGLVTLSAFGHLACRVVSQAPQTILMSSNAMEAYENATADVKRRFDEMLRKVANPLMREQKVHSFTGTDLSVYKPGNTSERMAYFVANDEVHVCELYPTHAQYVRKLPGSNRIDYPSRNFSVLPV